MEIDRVKIGHRILHGDERGAGIPEPRLCIPRVRQWRILPYPTRYPPTYGVDGNHRSSGGTPRLYVEHQVSAAVHRPTFRLLIPAGGGRRTPAE